MSFVPAGAPDVRLRRAHEKSSASDGRRVLVDLLWQLVRSGPLTLLTATRDIAHSQTAVLADRLRQDQAPMGDEAQQRGGDDEAQERGGDPACWLRRVCQQCGSMADADPPTTCPVCHADMPAE
jgi:rubrerythrin